MSSGNVIHHSSLINSAPTVYRTWNTHRRPALLFIFGCMYTMCSTRHVGCAQQDTLDVLNKTCAQRDTLDVLNRTHWMCSTGHIGCAQQVTLDVLNETDWMCSTRHIGCTYSTPTHRERPAPGPTGPNRHLDEPTVILMSQPSPIDDAMHGSVRC